MGCGLPGSSVLGVSQPRNLKWVAISSGDLPNPGIKPRSPYIAGRFFTVWVTREALYYAWVKSLSRVRLFATPWTIAHQAPPSTEFSREEYWRGLSFPSPGDLPDPGIEPRSPALQADTLPSEPQGKYRVIHSFLQSEDRKKQCLRVETPKQRWKGLKKEGDITDF